MVSFHMWRAGIPERITVHPAQLAIQTVTYRATAVCSVYRIIRVGFMGLA
jgi:hypothetical protein